MKTAYKVRAKNSLSFLKFNYLTVHGVLILIIMLSLLQLYVSDRFVTEGKKIKDAELQTDTLRAENQTLQNKIEKLSSLRNIQIQAQALGFVKIDKVRYLDEPFTVASR